MRDQLPDQPRRHRFTALSIVATFGALCFIFRNHFGEDAGFEGLGQAVINVAGASFCLFLTLVFGLVAFARCEPRGGRVAVAGVAVCALTHYGLNYAQRRSAVAAEHARTWSAIQDVFAQPDGRILLVGTGLLRLLPDGRQDPSFHRNYSFARGTSLPDPIREGMGDPPAVCAAMAPNGELLLGHKGWIGRVRPDGSDAPDLLNHSPEGACWGMAVQSDGKVVVAWDSEQRSDIVRLLPDGKVDGGFRAGVAPVRGSSQERWTPHERLVTLPDGKILVAGPVQSTDGACIRTLLRLNGDGSVDHGFRFDQSCQPATAIDRDIPALTAVFPDGSLLVQMRYAHRGGHETRCLDADGNDIPHAPICAALQNVQLAALAISPDGGLLVAPGYGLAKIWMNGKSDAAFREQEHRYASFRQIVVQGQKILVVNENAKLIRLDGDGRPDPSFQIPALRVYSD